MDYFGNFYFNAQGELISHYVKLKEESTFQGALRIEVNQNSQEAAAGTVIGSITPVIESKISVEKYQSYEAIYKSSLSYECRSSNNILDGLELSVGASIYQDTRGLGKASPFVSVKKSFSRKATSVPR